MAKNPTGKNRNRKQKLKEKYSKAREDAQLHNVIETTPEGAVKSEVVDPSTQDEARIPSLDREAIRNGWEVPEDKKPIVIDRLIEPFLENDIVVDKDGNQVKKPPDRYLLAQNAKALFQADKMQYERDNPEAAGKAKGGTEVNVNQVMVIDPYQLYKRMIEEQDEQLNLDQSPELRAEPQEPRAETDPSSG